MSSREEQDETIQDIFDLIDQEINKHYEDNFIAGLKRAKEIINEYFDLVGQGNEIGMLGIEQIVQGGPHESVDLFVRLDARINVLIIY